MFEAAAISNDTEAVLDLQNWDAKMFGKQMGIQARSRV